MKTSEEITYERLRELILNNHFPQGEFLSQRKLAQEVGATIVTLRSSLRLLENDGLIENVPKWGVRIPVETEKSMTDRYYLRELLEVGSLALIREHPDDGSNYALMMEKARICDSLRPHNSTPQEFARAHMDFHLTLTQLSGNNLLMMEMMRVNFRSMMRSNAVRAWSIFDETPDYHAILVEKMFHAEPEEAFRLLREHIRHGCELELATLRK